jgi:hypothetical protein
VKFGNLKSLGHNIADSVACGLGFPIGFFIMNVFAEAESGEPGYIEIDFLSASTKGAAASSSLKRAIELYSQALPDLASKHGIEVKDIKTLSARFGTDPVFGRHFTVTVESTGGRSSTDRYVGITGKRMYAKQGPSSHAQ